MTVDTHCPYCALQCGMRVGGTSVRVTIEGDGSFPVNKGALCIKGWTAGEPLGRADRLLTPLARDSFGQLVPVTWEEAIERVAQAFRETQAAHGKSAMLVGTAREVLGVIALADRLRPQSRAAVAALRAEGIVHVALLTGDNPATARAMAEAIGADDGRAELLPEQKVAAVRELRGRFGSVAMVGDGVNDAPALAAASVGVAMGVAGSDVALETADVALMADDLGRLPFLMRLGRATLSVIRQNIAFSLAIKAVAIAAVFPGWLTLWLAVLGDMGASVLVTVNGMRLLALRPSAAPGPGR